MKDFHRLFSTKQRPLLQSDNSPQRNTVQVTENIWMHNFINIRVYITKYSLLLLYIPAVVFNWKKKPNSPFCCEVMTDHKTTM